MNAAEIDLKLVWAYMLRRWRVVPVVMAVVIALILLLSWSVTERFEAKGLVRLANYGVGQGVAGSQGMVLEQLQAELSEELSVKFYPRPTGMVLVVGQADERELALRNAQLATDLLVEGSNKAVEQIKRERKDQISIMERHLDQLNQVIAQHMAVGMDSGLKERVLLKVFENVSPVLKLMGAREDLEVRISKTKIEYEMSLHPAEIVVPLAVGGSPFRPSWVRNMIVGVVFGCGFGVFVVFILGVFDQLICASKTHDGR